MFALLGSAIGVAAGVGPVVGVAVGIGPGVGTVVGVADGIGGVEGIGVGMVVLGDWFGMDAEAGGDVVIGCPALG